MMNHSINTRCHEGTFASRCASQRQQLTRDLAALSDQHLDQIGAWRGAIAATVTEIVAGQGCPTDG